MTPVEMTPVQIGQSYDAIADRWRSPDHLLSGLAAHRRAMHFGTAGCHALDVGCGCSGRFIDLLRGTGYTVEGIDISARMIALARERDPDITFHQADICDWPLPRRYDFISGWDSIWHVPLSNQAQVLRKLCDGLTGGGVLIFSTGGVDVPSEVRDAHMGPLMYHAAIGIPATLSLLTECGCGCRHLEYDQWPGPHVYIIAQKR